MPPVTPSSIRLPCMRPHGVTIDALKPLSGDIPQARKQPDGIIEFLSIRTSLTLCRLPRRSATLRSFERGPPHDESRDIDRPATPDPADPRMARIGKTPGKAAEPGRSEER